MWKANRRRFASGISIHTIPSIDELSKYDVGEKHPVMGSALKVALPSALKKGSTVSLKISYTTSKDCLALGWLTKE
jgi:leukotriene-A4 hydrolase